MVKGLFSICSNKSKLHHNRIVLSLQFRKLKRRNYESVQEWMSKMWTKAVECDHKEYGRAVTKQFIHELGD